MTSFLDNIVSHGPKPKVLTKDQAARSVVVKNIPPDATAVDVFIHFQQQKNTVKNGGGEIDHVHIPEKGTAVITFESSEDKERVLERPQSLNGSELKLNRYISTESPEVFQQVEAHVNCGMPPQTYHSMLKALKENTEVTYREGPKNIILYGTFTQIEDARTLLLCSPLGSELELVSAELCLELVFLLSRVQIIVLLCEVAAETGVKWIESFPTFVISGTFKQVQESHTRLQHVIHKSSGIVILNEVPQKCVERDCITPTEQQRLENRLVRMRQSLDDEIRLRSTREQDLREQLQRSLAQERQQRSGMDEEIRRGRSACTEMEKRLQAEQLSSRSLERDHSELLRRLEQEQQQKEQLQRSLVQERQQRSRMDEEIRRGRIACTEMEKRLQAEQLSSRSLECDHSELLRRLEQEQQQKEALEERLRGCQLQMEEERRRHLSAERELMSPMSAAKETAADYRSGQSRDWIVQREEIVLTADILGEGACGSVRKGTFRGCQVAVKEIHKLILSGYNRKRFEREMSIASCCRHPNLLQFIGATNDKSPLFVTELLDTSLRQVLSHRALNHEEIITLALDIAKGLNYLHLSKPRPIIHRDISSGNVLLWRRGESWRAKLSDYGAANFMRENMTVNQGAVIYAAPEAFTPQQTSKVDVYSFGVLLCEMCIREQPDPQKLQRRMGRVKNGVFRGLIQRCVERKPEARPTMSDVICELQ